MPVRQLRRRERRPVAGVGSVPRSGRARRIQADEGVAVQVDDDRSARRCFSSARPRVTRGTRRARLSRKRFFGRRSTRPPAKSPNHVRFVTYTTRYNNAHWVTVEGCSRKATSAPTSMRSEPTIMKQYTVTTKNVSRVKFDVPAASFTIDGQTIKAGANPTFEKTERQWAVAAGASRRTAQGPRPAGTDRGRVHGRVPRRARQRPAVERGRARLREPALRQLQVGIREVDARRHSRERRQLGVGRAISRTTTWCCSAIRAATA